jgi:hypothetical protein
MNEITASKIKVFTWWSNSILKSLQQRLSEYKGRENEAEMDTPVFMLCVYDALQW